MHIHIKEVRGTRFVVKIKRGRSWIFGNIRELKSRAQYRPAWDSVSFTRSGVIMARKGTLRNANIHQQHLKESADFHISFQQPVVCLEPPTIGTN